MSRPILKTLIFMLCAALVGIGSALPVSAADGAAQDISIPADYNKADALRAAITAVETQIPDFTIYYDMTFAPGEISGETCGFDPRGGYFGGCGLGLRESLIFDIGKANGTITGSIDDFFDGTQDLSEYDGKDLGEIVAIAKALPEYSTNAEFKEQIDDAAIVYERGLAALRNNLPKVDSALTGLDTKNSDELMTLYVNLPIVKDNKYTDLIERYQYALSIMGLYDYNPEYAPDSELENAYSSLVASALTVDPAFKITTSTSNESTPAIPSAPDTGTNQDGEASATIVAVAVVGIASIAAISGAIFVAKSYLFSPLKRRK